jgi:transcriptional regulator with PAS, ATPase and Fis domain
VAIAKGEIIQKEEVLVGLDENPLPDCSTAPDADEAAEQDLSLKTAEKRHILRVLRETGGNKRQAARLLGISRSRLDRKVAAIDSQ